MTYTDEEVAALMAVMSPAIVRQLLRERDEAREERDTAMLSQKFGSPDDPTGVKRGTEINALRARVASQERTITEQRGYIDGMDARLQQQVKAAAELVAQRDEARAANVRQHDGYERSHAAVGNLLVTARRQRDEARADADVRAGQIRGLRAQLATHRKALEAARDGLRLARPYVWQVAKVPRLTILSDAGNASALVAAIDEMLLSSGHLVAGPDGGTDAALRGEAGA